MKTASKTAPKRSTLKKLTALGIAFGVLVAGSPAMAWQANDESVNQGASVYLHVRAHADLVDHVVTSQLELETDSCEWGVVGGMAWVGYDASGRVVEYNTAALVAGIPPKFPGKARNETTGRVEIVNPSIVRIRTFAYTIEYVEILDLIDWDKLVDVAKQIGSGIAAGAGAAAP